MTKAGEVADDRDLTSGEATGDEVPDEKAPSDPEAVARIIVLRQLDRAARTRSELKTALTKRGIPDEPAERVLDRFVEVGLIDDTALADGYALAQHQARGLAGRAVALKLRRRGIEDETLQAAVEQIDPASEAVIARSLAERKLRSLSGLDPAVQARRLVGLLGRRGYSPGLAYRIVREVIAEAELADEEFAND